MGHNARAVGAGPPTRADRVDPTTPASPDFRQARRLREKTLQASEALLQLLCLAQPGTNLQSGSRRGHARAGGSVGVASDVSEDIGEEGSGIRESADGALHESSTLGVDGSCESRVAVVRMVRYHFRYHRMGIYGAMRPSAIGARGFEPPTARPPAGCATRLRHAPRGPSIPGTRPAPGVS